MTKRAAYVVLKFCLPLLIVFLCLPPLLAATQPRAVKGVLDLSQWNWEKDGMVDLNGEWEWYWKQLYAPSRFYEAHPPANTAYL